MFRGVIFSVVFALIFGIFVKLLWNWLMPPIFSLGMITYLQAFGLMLLARLLFGGFRHHRGGCHSRGRRWHGMYCGPKDWKWYSRGWKSGSDEVTDWHHYDEWWEREGKDAFKKYAGSRGEG